jgi:hypothetical protein
MEIPKRTWDHLVDLVETLDEYTTYGAFMSTTEQILDLLRVTIQDSKREIESCQD